jgi:hypothetical protein
MDQEFISCEQNGTWPFTNGLRGNGCLNTAWHREKNGQESHHAVPTLSEALPIVRRQIVQTETAKRRPLPIKAVAHKYLGRDGQSFPPKH